MRISDWSSDVCSSDLFGAVVQTENPVNFNVPVTIVDGDGDTAPGSLAITTAPPLLVIGSATDDDAGEPTDHVVANPQGQPDGATQGGDFDAPPLGHPCSVTHTRAQQANHVPVPQHSAKNARARGRESTGLE